MTPCFFPLAISAVAGEGIRLGKKRISSWGRKSGFGDRLFRCRQTGRLKTWRKGEKQPGDECQHFQSCTGQWQLVPAPLGSDGTHSLWDHGCIVQHQEQCPSRASSAPAMLCVCASALQCSSGVAAGLAGLLSAVTCVHWLQPSYLCLPRSLLSQPTSCRHSFYLLPWPRTGCGAEFSLDFFSFWGWNGSVREPSSATLKRLEANKQVTDSHSMSSQHRHCPCIPCPCLAASSPVRGRPETSACRTLPTYASHFSVMRKLVTLSGRELAFSLHTAHPLPSYSCSLNNWQCSWQNMPLSPQLFSWSAYSGCPFPFVSLETLQAQLSIFLCILKDHMLSSTKEQRLAAFVQEETNC